MRQFTDAAGEQWTASESGFYFGDADLPENDGFVEGVMAGVEFRSEGGQRATGYMTRGTIDGATDEQLRQGLADALQQHGEVQ